MLATPWLIAGPMMRKLAAQTFCCAQKEEVQHGKLINDEHMRFTENGYLCSALLQPGDTVDVKGKEVVEGGTVEPA